MLKNSSYTILLLFFALMSFAQNSNAELDSLVSKALKNNKAVKAGQLQVDKMKSNIKTAYNFEKTAVYYGYDQNNIAQNGKALPVYGVQQRFAFPTVYGAQKQLKKDEFERETMAFEIQKNRLSLEVSKAYQHIVFLQNQEKLYNYLDSLYQNFSKASDRRFELGETNYLEKITAQSKYRKISTLLAQIGNEKKANYELLKSLVQADENILIKSASIVPLGYSVSTKSQQLYNSYFDRITNTYQSNLSLQKQNWLPDLHLNYFQGKVSGLSPLHGFQVGLGLPILFTETKAKVQVAKIELQGWEQQKQNEQTRITQFIAERTKELAKYQDAINYYNQYGKKLSDEIIRVGTMSYKNGEIDFFQYIQSLENAANIQVEYLDNVLQFNKTQLDLQYLNF